MSTVRREFNENAAPNPVQQEFIRLAAEKYWYLGLGDMGHSYSNSQAFFYSSEMIEALNDGGKPLVAIEKSVLAQFGLEKARNPSINDQDFEDVVTHFMGPARPESDNRKIAKKFVQVSQQFKGVNFLAADTRPYMTLQSAKWRIAAYFAAGLIHSLANAFFNKMHDLTQFKLFKNLARQSKELRNSVLHKTLIDDHNIVSYIKKFEKPTAIFYGAAHLDKNCDNDSKPALMVNLLPEEGKDLCVLNIFEDFNQRAENEETSSDADLLVFPTEDHPEGIIIKNPALRPLFDQAVANVQALIAPHVAVAGQAGLSPV